MAAAVVQIQVSHGAGPTLTSAESPNSLRYNRQDDEAAGSPVIIPSVGNGLKSGYSNYKLLRLVVTTAGTTALSNFRVAKDAAEASGLKLFVLTTPPSSYTQCTGTSGSAGNRPADSASALAATPAPDTPASYSVLPQLASTFTVDAGSFASSSTGGKGNYAQLLLGVSDQYAGGAGLPALPALIWRYDEG